MSLEKRKNRRRPARDGPSPWFMRPELAATLRRADGGDLGEWVHWSTPQRLEETNARGGRPSCVKWTPTSDLSYLIIVAPAAMHPGAGRIHEGGHRG